MILENNDRHVWEVAAVSIGMYMFGLWNLSGVEWIFINDHD